MHNRNRKLGDKLCDVTPCYSAQHNGKGYIFFEEMMESKSYVNMFELVGSPDAIAVAANEVAVISDSVAFSTGEEI